MRNVFILSGLVVLSSANLSQAADYEFINENKNISGTSVVNTDTVMGNSNTITEEMISKGDILTFDNTSHAFNGSVLFQGNQTSVTGSDYTFSGSSNSASGYISNTFNITDSFRGSLINASASTVDFNGAASFDGNIVTFSDGTATHSPTDNYSASSLSYNFNDTTAIDGGLLYLNNASTVNFKDSVSFTNNKFSVSPKDLVFSGTNTGGVYVSVYGYLDANINGGLMKLDDSAAVFEGVVSASGNSFDFGSSVFTDSTTNYGGAYSMPRYNINGGLFNFTASNVSFNEELNLSNNNISLNLDNSFLRPSVDLYINGGLFYADDNSIISFDKDVNVFNNTASFSNSNQNLNYYGYSYGLFFNFNTANAVFNGNFNLHDNQMFIDNSNVTGNGMLAARDSDLTFLGDVNLVNNYSNIKKDFQDGDTVENVSVFGGITYLAENNLNVYGNFNIENNIVETENVGLYTNGAFARIFSYLSPNHFYQNFSLSNNAIKYISPYLYSSSQSSLFYEIFNFTVDGKFTVDNNTGDFTTTSATPPSFVGGAGIYYSASLMILGDVELNGETSISNNRLSYIGNSDMEFGHRAFLLFQNGTADINNTFVMKDNSLTLNTTGDLNQVANLDSAGMMGLEVSALNFDLSQPGQYILIENNLLDITANNASYQKLNSFNFLYNNIDVNFDLEEGTYANIRDPMRSEDIQWGEHKVNKFGLGSMYLWGDNSDYHGQLNIDEGNFYAMFEENQTAEQQAVDPSSQRVSFNLNNATITFADSTYFRPMMNAAHDKLAVLTTNNSNLTVNGTSYLAPYNLSSLDVGGYSFANDYSMFSGWSSSLAELNINGNTSVDLTIKSDLAGYDGLNYLADIYRKRSDLSLMEREVLDNIYITGLVPSGFHDLFEIIEGQDYEVFEQVHRASVRQFNRQVVSRIQNKNCESCGRDSGYSDQHFWFNVSHNEIKKDSTSKSLGYEYDPTGFAMGYDHDFIPNELNMGIAISYATGDVKNKTSGAIKSESNVDEYLMSFYGKYKPFRAYAAWNAGGGLMTNKTRLNSSTVNTRGEYDTYAFFANTELGYDWGKTTCELLETYVGLEYTHIFSEGYDERGIGARHFDRMDWDIFEVPIGVRASKDLFWNEYIFTPAIDLAYARNFGDTSAKTRAAFIGNRGDSWSISSSSDKRDSLRFNFNFKINNLILPFALNLGYSIDYRSDYTDQQFYGTLRWDF